MKILMRHSYHGSIYENRAYNREFKTVKEAREHIKQIKQANKRVLIYGVCELMYPQGVCWFYKPDGSLLDFVYSGTN